MHAVLYSLVSTRLGPVKRNMCALQSKRLSILQPRERHIIQCSSITLTNLSNYRAFAADETIDYGPTRKEKLYVIGSSYQRRRHPKKRGKVTSNQSATRMYLPPYYDRSAISRTE